jgi:ribosomal protein S18 acetylase RimI-like enzyme
MPTTTHVRDAVEADSDFLVASNAAMARETEHRTLDPGVLRRGVAGVFERADRGFYLVAEQAAVAVGCLLVTREWSDWRDRDWWWLQSVYVVPQARRSGVFSRLLAEVDRRARTTPRVAGLRLYVERDNARAMDTYRQQGFVETAYRLLERPSTPGDGH